MTIYKRYELQFFTATILEWKKLLQLNKYKDIIIESLKFLVQKERVVVHAFVIMDNHIHIIWAIKYPHKREDIQRDFFEVYRTENQIRFVGTSCKSAAIFLSER